MIIDTQAVNTMLTWLGISVGAAVFLALAFLAAVAAWQRYDRKEHVSALERYLAAVAGQRRPSRRVPDQQG
jgi:membrane protein implicated in regulation of membrane protease activity